MSIRNPARFSQEVPLNAETVVLREKLNDPAYLPRLNEVLTVHPDTPSFVKYTGDKRFPKFEVLTEEYVTALAGYLAGRLEQYAVGSDSPLTILEIGAGDGRLTHFLEQKLAERYAGEIRMVAVDTGADNRITPIFPVERMDHVEALRGYQPDIIVCSWMPYEIDFSQDFRDTASVKEYVLIGEPWDDMTGYTERTWGYTEGGRTPPHERDGFTRVELDDLSKLQIGRSDAPKLLYKPGQVNKSITASFRRN